MSEQNYLESSERFQRISEQFVGRDEIVEYFDSVVSSNLRGINTKVLHFYGVGGVGKSWLMTYLALRMQESPHTKIPSVFLDLSNYSGGTPPETYLLEIRKQLKKVKIKCRRFDLLWIKHFEKTTGFPYTQAPATVIPDELDDLAGLVEFASKIPIIGAAVDVLQLGDFLLAKLSSWWETRYTKDWRKVIENLTAMQIALIMPEALASDLNDALVPKQEESLKILFFLDTLERLSTYNEQSFVRSLAYESDCALLITAGRDKIEWGTFEENNVWIEGFNYVQKEVSEFGFQESAQYLRKQQIMNIEAALQLHQLTHGNPLGLGLVVDLLKGQIEVERDEYLDKLIDEIRPVVNKTILGYLISQLESNENEELKDVIRAVAVPRWFNYEIAWFMLHDKRSALHRLFPRLSKFSFVQVESENICKLHEQIRETILETLHSGERETWEQSCLDYFAVQASKVPKFKSAKYRLEQVFHQLNLDEKKAVELIVDLLVDAQEFAAPDLYKQVLYEIENHVWSNTSFSDELEIYCNAQVFFVENKWEEAEKNSLKLLQNEFVYPLIRGSGAATLATIYLYQGKHYEAISVLQRGIKILRKLDNKRTLSRLLTDLGRLYSITYKWREAKVCFDESEQNAETYTIELGRIWVNRVIFFTMQGYWEQALNAYRNAETYLLETQDNYGYGKACYRAGQVLFFKGELDQSLRKYEEALHIMESFKDSFYAAVIKNYLARVLTARHQFSEANELLKESEVTIANFGSAGNTMIAADARGVYFTTRGTYAEAIRALKYGLQIAAQIRDNFWVYWIIVSLGNAYLESGDYTMAQRLFAYAELKNADIGNQYKLAEAMVGLCQSLVELSDYERLRAKFPATLDLCQQMHYNHCLARLHLLSNHVYPDRNQFAEYLKACNYALKHNRYFFAEILQMVSYRIPDLTERYSLESVKKFAAQVSLMANEVDVELPQAFTTLRKTT